MLKTIIGTSDGKVRIAIGLTPEDWDVLYTKDRYMIVDFDVPIVNWNGEFIILAGRNERDIANQLPPLSPDVIVEGPQGGRA